MITDFWKPLRDLTFEDVDSLRTSGDRERSILDYKRFNRDGGIDSAELAKDLAAFANSGGGRLIFGAIEQDERLAALRGVPESEIRRITSTIRNTAHRVQPPVDVETREIRISDGTVVFVLEIRPGQIGPFQFDGRYLQRASSGNVAMPHTSVVNAVRASTRDGVPSDYDGTLRVRTLTLGNNSKAMPGLIWACGVELRPAYRQPKDVYDPLDQRTQSIMQWLDGHGYHAGDVKRRIETLYAKHNTGHEVELTRDGWVTAIAYLDAADRHNQIFPEEVSSTLERLLDDCAGCLERIEPFFTVSVSARIWGVDGKGLHVVWDEGSLREKRAFRIEKPTNFLQGDREYRVHELVNGGSTALGRRFAEHLKIHVSSA